MYKKKKIIAVLFARTNSSRLKSKLFRKILNTNLLIKNIKIAKKILYVDKIIIATTDNKEDKKIVSIAKKMKVEYFRGSEKNVLDRFYKCLLSQNEKFDYAIRFCCDNYMTIPKLVEQNIIRAVNLNLDLITPGEFALCTKGTSQVVISFNCLKKIFKLATHKTYNEHVENYCFENFKKYKIDYQIVDKKFYFENLNFSIDTFKQLNFIRKNKIKKINQKILKVLNKKVIKDIDRSLVYSVDKSKYFKKNRIGYFYLSDYFKPRKKIKINDSNINNKNYLLLKKIFNSEFEDKNGYILFPDFKNNKFIKLKFKKFEDKKWNSFFYQKKRILAYRQKFLIK